MPTEPVAEGAQAIRNLAEAIDTPEAWRNIGAAGNPGFTGSWGNVASGAEPCAFCRDRSGFVHMKGAVGGSATNSAGNQQLCGVLPVGYRPPHHMRFALWCWTGAAEGALVRMEVYADGLVQLVCPSDMGRILAEVSIQATWRATVGTTKDADRDEPEPEPLGD